MTRGTTAHPPKGVWVPDVCYLSYWMLLLPYHTSPTSCSAWITVPLLVDVTYRLMWPLVMMYKEYALNTKAW